MLPHCCVAKILLGVCSTFGSLSASNAIAATPTLKVPELPAFPHSIKEAVRERTGGTCSDFRLSGFRLMEGSTVNPTR
ncbi:hypothetical protein DFJ73DRAFT_828402 [Zopfochytrium polystomum]|nr:hypothetical protein DFJ73DRAFT_828402 [Zopfochytrium polystomum]